MIGRPLAVYAQSRELKDNISLGSNFQKPQQYFNFECKFNKHQILKKTPWLPEMCVARLRLGHLEIEKRLYKLRI